MYTPAQLARDVGCTVRSIQLRIAKEQWVGADLTVKGGKTKVFKFDDLPDDIRFAVEKNRLNHIASTADVQHVNAPGWASDIAVARATVIRVITTIREERNCSQEAAIQRLLSMLADGTAPDSVSEAVRTANAKAGAGRKLTRRTIFNWLAEAKTAGDHPGCKVDALLPKNAVAKQKEIPAWAPALLELYAQPTKPSLAYCVERLAPQVKIEEKALYHRAQRLLKSMGSVEREVGRLGSRELKTIKPYVERDFEALEPTDVYSADGYKFDAEVGHPVHGRPFRPEITSVIDIGTRKVVGFSIDLAESGLAVLDALRIACENGDPAIFYVDNGVGYKDKRLSDHRKKTQKALESSAGLSMAARLGFDLKHSLPYNSQARGVIERFHQTWKAAAKTLPTYLGDDMDRQAQQKVFKLTRKDIKLAGRSDLLMPFNVFIGWANDVIAEYNNRPHSSLPKIRDPKTGKKRHMSPNELWDAKVAKLPDALKPVPVLGDVSRSLFRPRVERKTRRGLIELFTNTYFSEDLEQYHNEVVQVGYDVHDGRSVLVYDSKGRFLCEAKAGGNKADYFPVSAVEHAREKRAKGRLRRLEVHAEEVRAELEAALPVPLALEDAQSMSLSDLTGDVLMQSEPEPVAQEAEALNVIQLRQPPSEERPVFYLESDRYRWLMQHTEHVTARDWEWLLEFVSSDLYPDLADMFAEQGIAWQPEKIKIGELR